MGVMKACPARVTVVFLCMVIAALCVMAAHVTGASTTEPPVPPADKVIARGLQAWRRPDERGMACAHCHGPDGFELARFDFGDDDFRRHDAIHTPSPNLDAVVAMIHAVRDRHRLNGALLDPHNDRPFQPGGQLVAGDTAPQRDYATALISFAPRLPTLFNGRVDSPLKALRARNEILAFDLRTEKIGVPFPRLVTPSSSAPSSSAPPSSAPPSPAQADPARPNVEGSAASVDGWFPVLPRRPKPGYEAVWYALHDAYLADPNEASLWALYNASETHTEGVAGASPEANAYALAQYQSLLLGQHLLREQVIAADMAPRMTARRPIVFLEIPAGAGRRTRIHNPMFTVGHYAPHQRLTTADRSAPGPLDRGVSKPMVAASSVQARLSWWFLAWTFNFGLPDVRDRREDFLQAIAGASGAEPYPIHAQFARIKIDLTQAFSPYERIAGRPPQADALRLSDASRGFDYADAATQAIFFNDHHRRLYHVFTANVRRMQLYLLLNEFNKQCADDRPYINFVGDEVEFVEGLRTVLLPELARVQPEYASADRDLIEETVRRLQEAWNRCAPLPAPGGGHGLWMSYFDGVAAALTTDARIAARSDHGFADAALPGGRTGISIRWMGEIEPRFGGAYEIAVQGRSPTDCRFRLWTDGRLLIDTWQGNVVKGRAVEGVRECRYAAAVTWQAGRRYAIRLECRECDAHLPVRLIWKSARQAPEVVPRSQLYSSPELDRR